MTLRKTTPKHQISLSSDDEDDDEDEGVRRGTAKGGNIKGPWTTKEDTVLLQQVDLYGPRKWSEIAKCIPGRIGKQCRERWMNHLDPDVIKSEWTAEEDQILFDQQKVFGNRWSKIAKFLVGRSENNVKNRWNSLKLRKFMSKDGRQSADGALREKIKKGRPVGGGDKKDFLSPLIAPRVFHLRKRSSTLTSVSSVSSSDDIHSNFTTPSKDPASDMFETTTNSDLTNEASRDLTNEAMLTDFMALGLSQDENPAYWHIEDIDFNLFQGTTDAVNLPAFDDHARSFFAAKTPRVKSDAEGVMTTTGIFDDWNFDIRKEEEDADEEMKLTTSSA
jgi:hypothetical protein